MSDFHFQTFDTPVAIPSQYTKDLTLESRVHTGSGHRGRICVVVCHPYGPMGGDLNSNVVVTLTRFFATRGFSTARFNFRGVGGSGGETSKGGDAEEGDLKSVCAALAKEGLVDGWKAVEKFVVIGYSYGAAIAASTLPTLSTILPSHLASPILALITISYPYTVLPSITLYQGFLALQNAQKVDVPKLLITGGEDGFTSAEEHGKWVGTLRDPKREVVVEGADHFWVGLEQELEAVVARWLAETVKGFEGVAGPDKLGDGARL
ncbi:alpha/beta-hydrolase [Gonapodya prolifera JEL478]|uniref:Alpha/beta-hydrolase n=1 Tax=Gonapodya prolifera (strain JEL478) TaxID=1344416 RepID=A0A139AKE6_GONPJ|nr:alpha/beta-hydrolase [Gonapodya prolifera JEL478]|eukprot:KXS17250.1 alpha/beta-hydrolase [Gonapodya prolifera JEL478]